MIDDSRATAIIAAAQLEPYYSLEPYAAEGASAAWFYGPYVLRYRAAAAGEANLLRALPPSVPHAPLLASGEDWIVQRRMEGSRLSEVWKTLDAAKQRAAAQQFAAIMINLHQVRVRAMPSLSPGWFAAILPGSVLRMAVNLRALNPDLMTQVIDFTRRTMTYVQPPLRWGFVHRSLHFGHVLWNGERITALIGFDSAIFAPRELEIDAFLRFIRSPSDGLTGDDLANVPQWLKEDYPLLFSQPGVEERLRLYSIERDLRLLSERPSEAAQRELLQDLYLTLAW